MIPPTQPNIKGDNRAIDQVHPPQIQSGTRQLFLDDELVTSADNIRRVLHQPTKHAANPLLTPEHPWEGQMVLLYGTVLHDPAEDLFKMWYQAFGPETGNVVCYATSRDGLRWERAPLGVTEVLGSRDNNVVFGVANHPNYIEMHSVVQDDDDPDPARRYKMTFHCRQGEQRDYHTATSPDGIHWTARQGPAIRYPENCADISHCIKDPRSGKFVLWARTRCRAAGVEARDPDYIYGRAIARSESEDFEQWTQLVTILHVDEEDPVGSDIYTLAAFPYEGIYIGLAQMYYGMKHEGLLNIQLACSRDGWGWERVVDREVFLPCGGVGEWDRYNQSVAGQPVARGNELWFYYGGRTCRHSPYEGRDNGPRWGGIGLATLRRDGFCSMESSFDGGCLTTVPLFLPRGDLHLNLKSDFGSAQVEVLDENGAPIPGAVSLPLRTDCCDATVSFPDGFTMDSVLGRPVCLRFRLSNARLFSFWSE